MTHILISPAWRHLSDWIHRVPELSETSGTVVYDSRNRIKKFTLLICYIVFRRSTFFTDYLHHLVNFDALS